MLLHAQIESNKRKTWLITGGFIVFFALVSAGVACCGSTTPLAALFFAVIFGGIYIAIMMATGTKVVMAMNSAREIRSEDENPFLWNTVESLTIAAPCRCRKSTSLKIRAPTHLQPGCHPKTPLSLSQGDCLTV